jgi:hypothetical protein
MSTDMMNDDDFECALSGQRAPAGVESDEDGLGNCPAGWIAVRMMRRVYNPKWTLLQRTKQGLVQAALQQLPRNTPAELVEQQREQYELQVDAQFFHIEAQTPVYMTFSETIYVSPPETDRDVLVAFNAARADLGMARLQDSALGIQGLAEDEAQGDDAGTQGESAGG